MIKKISSIRYFFKYLTTLVSSLSSIRLLGKQMTKSESKMHLCKNCFQNFDDSSKLEKHSMECNKNIAYGI